MSYSYHAFWRQIQISLLPAAKIALREGPSAMQEILVRLDVPLVSWFRSTLMGLQRRGGIAHALEPLHNSLFVVTLGSWKSKTQRKPWWGSTERSSSRKSPTRSLCYRHTLLKVCKKSALIVSGRWSPIRKRRETAVPDAATHSTALNSATWVGWCNDWKFWADWMPTRGPDHFAVNVIPTEIEVVRVPIYNGTDTYTKWKWITENAWGMGYHNPLLVSMAKIKKNILPCIGASEGSLQKSYVDCL